VTYSPGVPGGAVPGATWSKKPPFSSYVTNIAVFAHCTGFVLKAVIIEERVFSPKSEGVGGLIGVNDGGDHPGDLWQISRQCIRQKVSRKLRQECVLVERGIWVLEILEI